MRIEQEALQRLTGQAAACDGEPLVSHSGDERGQHRLQAEAAAEVRVIDVIAHKRQGVHHARVDIRQRLRQFRHGRRQLAQHRLLKRRVVRDDHRGATAGLDDARGHLRTRIARIVSKPGVVRHVVLFVDHMTAELHGHLIVGPASVPHRNRQRHGFEVEDRARIRDSAQGVAQ